MKARAGFTAIELLVAIVVAMLLLGGAYQLYSASLTSAGSAQRRSLASNAAYEILRSNSTNATNPCSARTISNNAALPPAYGLPGANYTTTITCPYGTTTNLNLLSVSVYYNNPERLSVTRAIVVMPEA